MKAIKNLFKDINDGREGKNIGISMGLPDLDKILYGIQRKSLYVVGADTGGGKTTFGLDVFIYNAVKNAGDKNISILYYSFEMSETSLLAKILSRYIYDEFNEVVTYEEILSLTSPLSEEKYQYVLKSQPWLVELSKKLTVYDKQLSPGAIYATLKGWLEKHGKFIPIDDHREDYIEDDDEQYRIVVTDHVGLIGGQGSKKERIDKVVDYFIYFREKCNITGVLIQQLNRNAKGMDRKLNGYELIQLDDFSDTSGTTQGANIVIGLYYPHREKIPRCEGYPIQNVLRQRFRLVQVLKNRFGKADVNKGVTFHGEIGMFRELPKPEDISNYEKYLELKYEDDLVINQDNIQLDENENENGIIFNF